MKMLPITTTERVNGSVYYCNGLKTDDTHFNWRKKSIFFDLSYWETNLLCHCLDIMLVEKNVCELLLTMILNIKDKIKDDLNFLFDLKE